MWYLININNVSESIRYRGGLAFTSLLRRPKSRKTFKKYHKVFVKVSQGVYISVINYQKAFKFGPYGKSCVTFYTPIVRIP